MLLSKPTKDLLPRNLQNRVKVDIEHSLLSLGSRTSLLEDSDEADYYVSSPVFQLIRWPNGPPAPAPGAG